MDATKPEDLSQLQVKFFTKQEQYSVSDTPYSVPASIDVDGLCLLINKLLQSDQPENNKIEFDFLLSNQLLRVPLQVYIEEHGLSSETVIDIEYLERQSAPEPEDSLLHDDWVSAVRACGNYILTGCYDNTLHIWNIQGEHILALPSHSKPIKCVAWSGVDEQSSTYNFVSGSQDQTLTIWKWNSESNEVECAKICKDHDGSVDCVGINKSKTMMCSGSWDCIVKLWEAGINDSTEDDTVPKKKRKKSTEENIRPPIQSMGGHKEGVSGCLWSSDQEIITSSWDHSIRTWDVAQNKNVTTIDGAKAVFGIDYQESNGLLISASADRHIRLYDTKHIQKTVVKSSFTSHTAWVTSVKWCPNNPMIFLSGSNDGIAKVWDVRSPDTPLYDMRGSIDRILAVDWSNPDYLMCGGVDNKLWIYKHTSTGGELVVKK